MSLDRHVIQISEEEYLGKGVHRAAYIDHEDETKIIKILFDPNDLECQRELAYRKSRKNRGLSSELLTEYYGTCETNMGLGYIFERVLNDDGSIPEELDNYLQRQEDRQNPDEEHVKALLVDFGKTFFKEKVVVSNMHCNNLMVQAHADGEEKIRIIDNIGCPTKIPLAYYFDFVALKRARKYWKRFIEDLVKRFPKVMTKSLQQTLMNVSAEAR